MARTLRGFYANILCTTFEVLSKAGYPGVRISCVDHGSKKTENQLTNLLLEIVFLLFTLD